MTAFTCKATIFLVIYFTPLGKNSVEVFICVWELTVQRLRRAPCTGVTNLSPGWRGRGVPAPTAALQSACGHWPLLRGAEQGKRRLCERERENTQQKRMKWSN